MWMANTGLYYPYHFYFAAYFSSGLASAERAFDELKIAMKLSTIMHVLQPSLKLRRVVG